MCSTVFHVPNSNNLVHLVHHEKSSLSTTKFSPKNNLINNSYSLLIISLIIELLNSSSF